MKIAIVRQRYNPFGGAERFVERALAALAERGAEVTLITRNWDGAPREGFNQVICDPPYSRLLGGRVAREHSFARSVQAEWTRGAYDITQSHERIPGCMIFRAGDGVHAAWLERRGRLLNPWQRAVQHFSGFHRYLLNAEREMFTHPALRVVICNSQMVADEVSGYYGVVADKLRVIYNGIDLAIFHPGLVDEFRLPVRTALGIPLDSPVLLHVGSGFARKGVPELLRAFAGLRSREAHLLIVGADRRIRAAKMLASSLNIGERVHFTGGVQDVRPFYGAADGFVLNTFYDPSPNAALEAMACGLPIVTTTSCGAQEWVVPGVNGWVVDALDNAALTTALEKLASVAGNAASRQSARAAVGLLTPEMMSFQLLDLYKKLL